MAKVDNPNERVLGNHNLIVTSHLDKVDLVIVNFIASTNPIGGTMTISPTQVQIPRGTSLNSNNIVLDIQRPDIRTFGNVEIREVPENQGSYPIINNYTAFLNTTFNADETNCYFKDVEIGKRWYVTIIGTEMNPETHGYYEFSGEYSFEYTTKNPENDILVQKDMANSTGYNSTDPSCDIKYFVIRDANNDGSFYEPNGRFCLTIPSEYKIVDAYINNMSYGFTESTSSSNYGIEILAIKKIFNRKEIDMKLLGEGSTQDYIALQISKA